MVESELEKFFESSAKSEKSPTWLKIPSAMQDLVIAMELFRRTPEGYKNSKIPVQLFTNLHNHHIGNDTWVDNMLSYAIESRSNEFSRVLRKARKLSSSNYGAIFLKNASCCKLSPVSGLILFVKNFHLLSSLPLPPVGFFQSRTKRIISPDDDWLCALLYSLEISRKFDITYVSSSGTIPYDIVSTWCIDSLTPTDKRYKHWIPLIYVHPRALPLRESRGSTSPFVEVSCSIGRSFCDKRQSMVCRDSIVAAISSCHVVIGIRRKGTLAKMFAEEAALSKKPKAVWKHSMEVISTNSTLWEVPTDWKSRAAEQFARVSLDRVEFFRLSVDWNQYLYHYTRSAYGPMADESREDYIKRLIAQDPLIANKAIDILIHISNEGILKASPGMHGKPIVKGGFPVVCWTAVPPHRLSLIKRWNRALIRWTFEPYGIAVMKKILKKSGAKPVCYLPEKDFYRLPESERYRFQKHEPPKVDWKAEREWRIPCDVNLNCFEGYEAFWIVASRKDAAKFLAYSRSSLPVYVIEVDGFAKRAG